jgi:hypothetical protein
MHSSSISSAALQQHAEFLAPVSSRGCGADFGALIRKQYDEYGRVIRQATIKAE